MIIFYNKTTGDIIGTINGRIHTADQLNTWIGPKDVTERIIYEWKPKKVNDKYIFKIETGDIEIDKLLSKIDSGEASISHLKVHPITKKLFQKIYKISK